MNPLSNISKEHSASNDLEVKIEMKELKKQSSITALAKYQIETELQPTLAEIHNTINQQLTLKRIAYLTACELLKELRKRYGKTILKVVFVSLSLATLYPLVIGAIASFNSFRFASPSDLFSSNDEKVNAATQLHANTGHGVGYLWEALGINAVAWTLLVRHVYYKSIAKVINETFKSYIESPSLSREESNFLYDKREKELALWGFTVPMVSD